MARIFISYSWQDSEVVTAIVRRLKSEGHAVWVDREALRPTDDWLLVPEKAIRETDVFIIFISVHSITSSNVLRELEIARIAGKPIIPLVLNLPLNADLLKSALPPGLQSINLTENLEHGINLLMMGLSAMDFREQRNLPTSGPPPTAGSKENNASKNSGLNKKNLPGDSGDWSAPTWSESKHTTKAKPPDRGAPTPTSPVFSPKAGRVKTGRALPRQFAPRYANVILYQADVDTQLDASAPLKSGSDFRLRLDIGELSRLSAVRTVMPIPDQLLPTNIWLDVTISSTDFEVGRSREDLGQFTVAEGRFFLPSNGSPAQTETGGQYLYFRLRTPKHRGLAHARINYYYRNHLVQSQLLAATIGGGASRYVVDTDYTMSESLVDLESLPKRNQISILTNDNGNGTHQFVIRAANADGNLLKKPLTFELNSDAIGNVVRDLRTQMRNEPIAPTQRKRNKDQLKNDLKTLAPLGWDLFTDAKLGNHLFDLYPLINREDLVVQVTRPESSGFAFPWGLIYDIEINSNDKLNYCSLVEEWDGKSSLVPLGTKTCPKKSQHDSNTLCPFGFWGYRYAIEQLSKTDEPVRMINAPLNFEMVVGETQYEVSKDQLKQHVSQLQKILKEEFSGAFVVEGTDVNSIQSLLAQDTPLIYFYCHGERTKPGSPDTYLGVGNNQKITPGDFIGWVKKWWNNGKGIRVWDHIHPLIFVNACHSLEINPDSLVTYLDAFIGTAHAAGVIGTEVKVNQGLAMEAATLFFTYFFKGDTAGEALHKVRIDFLASGNLFGLVYTPYCWSDLKICKT